MTQRIANPRHFNQSVAILLVALLCIAAIGSLQLPRLNQLKGRANNISSLNLKREIESEKIRLNLLRNFPSFGFNNLVADWTFINFAQYFGDDAARSQTGYSLSPEYFEVILERDPYFLDAYSFLSGSTTLYAGMPGRTIAIMEKHLKSLSPKVPHGSYYIWRYKGTDELLFLGDSQAAKQSFATAAEWASHYSDDRSKQIAKISRQTAKFLERNPKSNSAQISAWVSVLDNAFDDNTRKLAISRIQALGGKISTSPDGQVNVQFPKKD